MAVMINAIRDEIASQLQEKKRLETLLNEVTSTEQQYATEMIEWSALIRDIEDITDLERYTILSERQKIVEVFTIEATFEVLSPRILRLTVHWRYPEWKSEAAIWIRESKPVLHWTKQEKEKFEQLIGNVSPLELLKAFPNRSWKGLRGIQWKLKLSPLIPEFCPIPEIESSWCWQDYQLIKKFGLISDEIKIMNAGSGQLSLLPDDQEQYTDLEDVDTENLVDEEENEQIWSRVMEIHRLPTEPMTDQEVIALMEESGASFYPFFNEETESVNVMYKLNGGGYGLLIPAVEQPSHKRNK